MTMTQPDVLALWKELEARVAAGDRFAGVVLVDRGEGVPERLEGRRRIGRGAGLAGRPGAEQGWHFLTGPQPIVRQIAETVGFPYRYDAELDQYLHPAGFVLAPP